MWVPLEHSDRVVKDHVDLDYLWMASWDACGTLGGGCRPAVAIWRTMLSLVVHLSRRPVFFDKDCLRLFRSPDGYVYWACMWADGIPLGDPGR